MGSAAVTSLSAIANTSVEVVDGTIGEMEANDSNVDISGGTFFEDLSVKQGALRVMGGRFESDVHVSTSTADIHLSGGRIERSLEIDEAATAHATGGSMAQVEVGEGDI